MITLLGEPRSTSHIYKSVCMGRFPRVYMSKQGKDLKESYQWQAKSQWHATPLTRGLKLTLRAYFGTKRTQDIDNFNKLVLDALTGIVWEDDSQIQELHIYKDYCKENPRIELEVTELSTS